LQWNSATNKAEFVAVSGGGGSQTLNQTLGFGNTSSLGMSVGIITATEFYGDGSGLTNLPGGGESYWASTSAGINTLSNVGIGTTNSILALTVVGDGFFTGVVSIGTTNIPSTLIVDGDIYVSGTVSTDGLFVNDVGIFSSSSLIVANQSGTYGYIIAGDEITDNYTLKFPIITSDTGIAVTGIAQTFTALQTFNNGIQVGIITATSINFASGGVLGDLYTDGGIGIGLKASPANYYAVVASNNLQQFLQVDDNQIFITTGYASTTGTYDWKFDKNGTLTFPDLTIQGTAFTGYAPTAGIATYATSSGIATYATNAGIATFATSSGIATFATTAGYATTSGISTTSQGLTGTPNISVGIITATDYRIQSVAEKTTLVDGNTVSLVYNTGGGNVAICTNPSGNITLNVTGIPTDSAFDNYSLAFSVIVTNTGTARSCTAINLNGLSRTIKWFGGSLASAISGVTTSNGYDVYSFTGINTVGSASTTANYVVLGSVNGSYR
jgi:hypothetical protein